MRILHITAQKPNSTGSGVYMSGLIESMSKLGHEQGVIAGIDIKDNKNSFEGDIKYYPVIYNSKELPFPVMGMSDNMPYESTRYKDLTPDMVRKIKKEFLKTLEIAVEDFKPDIIICNHLYLITSFVREAIKDIKIMGICHGTCFRQLKNINLEREYIVSQISNLDAILVLHENQKKEIIETFNINREKIFVIGSGYDEKIFHKKSYQKEETINITYAGKICKSKGLKSFLQAVNKLKYAEDKIIINFAGGGSDKKEVADIKALADKCKYKVIFQGKLAHENLAELFNKSHIFILPSFYEGLPVVVLEALACGCKVIVSEFSGLRDFLGEDINKSETISYIKLPRMKSVGIPIQEDLKEFEDNIALSLENFIKTNNNKPKEVINLKEKTWEGLGLRVDKIIKSII